MDRATHFLLVDDDPIFLVVAEGIVCSLGDFKVSTALNGAEGIEALSKAGREFDYILLDLNMPEFDGLAFLRAASVLGFQGKLIISSGESEAVLRSAGRMAELLGIDVIGTLRKPISAVALASIICGAPPESKVPERTQRVAPSYSTATLEIVPYYQAQHDAYDRSIRGLEALVRTRSADGQIHGPERLFELMRGHSELVATTLAIAAKVFDDMKAWQAEGIYCRTSINLDAKVLEDAGVGPALVKLAKEREIPPELICLELTENALAGDMTRLIEAMTRLRIGGFQLSVDDFGIGSSNFELLRLCPFTEMKIDGSVIRSAAKEPIARHFMSSAVTMAAELHIDVVGEGIETESQLALARECGIEIIQGFLFSMPVPAATISHLLAGGPVHAEA